MNNDNYLDDDANDCECDKGDDAFVLIRIQMISKIQSLVLIIVNLLHHFQQSKMQLFILFELKFKYRFQFHRGY